MIQLILYQARMADVYRQWATQLREQAKVRIDEFELVKLKVSDETRRASPSAGG